MLVATPPPLFTSFTSSVYEPELDLGAYLHADVFAHDAPPIVWLPSTPASVFRTVSAPKAGTVDTQLALWHQRVRGGFRQRRRPGPAPRASNRYLAPLPRPCTSSTLTPTMGVIRRRGARSSQGRHAWNGAQGHRGQRRCREAVRARRPPSFNPRQRPSPNDDDDELPADWRCSPEDMAKMSSKEKRQLRNKISARNFRVRCKAYISNLEEDLAQRDALVELCQCAARGGVEGEQGAAGRDCCSQAEAA
ncbi:Proteophosphoglycan ppg4 [Mycena kentingensis (nom. inval.)]|nr:Proteophosphoglycan ppg4 [Mycena kentingensis (nom. inval.)]